MVLPNWIHTLKKRYSKERRHVVWISHRNSWREKTWIYPNKEFFMIDCSHPCVAQSGFWRGCPYKSREGIESGLLACFTGTCLCTRGVCFSSSKNGCSLFEYCWLLGMVVNFWTFIKWLGFFLVMAFIFSLHIFKYICQVTCVFLSPI